ncbi:F-box protein CPR1 isoform X2 [Spinacia oleracea]|uniref:F-box protein CPR1 isoform X2 n=1 Tax=Spinacia oleracea TaxID=3562 RepID=A0ABM3RW31_SPIOL|nr:F-box protein CPR1-like isoform X2 [Spinacia oleracea]XP_056699841.1 F-box protein CPR1-like isoform X2 [Spinacia oleracea]
MAVLPTEIIAEILSKLPVKILLRFLCVCKAWNLLIKTPNFIKLHLNQTLISNSDRHILLYYPFLYSAELDIHHDRISFSKLHHPLSPLQVHLFGSCNGIICIADPSKTDIFLFNPLTKSHRKLPANKILNSDIGYVLFGFGYDSKNDDYKVLRLVQGFTNDKMFYSEAKLCSLNNNSWKSVEGISLYLIYADCHGVLVNEALHYIVNSEELGSSGKFIASFDLQNESFSLMDCSKFLGKGESNLMMLLTELDGCLCVMVNHLNNFILERADLWVMKEYGNKESWAKLYSIGQECVRSGMQIKPIVYSKDGKSILLEIDVSKFAWYDLESKNVEIFTPRGLPDGALETGCFIGSLVSLDNKLDSEKETLPKKNKKKKVIDNFLSAGFKLRL